MLAAQRGHVGSLRLLLRHGADVMQADQYGWTALIYGSELGDLETIEVLLDAGSDLTQKAKFGGTCLTMAAEKGHAAAVSLLLARGADITQADSDGTTSLLFACREGHVDALTRKDAARARRVDPGVVAPVALPLAVAQLAVFGTQALELGTSGVAN